MALDWTREESILALAVYFQARSDITGKVPDTESAVAKELSETLRRLNAHPPEEQKENYRTKNSVRLKLANFLSAQRAGSGMSNHSLMDAAILREFFDNREELFTQATDIRAGIESGTLQPAHPDTTWHETPIAAEIDVENQHAASFDITVPGSQRTGKRAEAQLVRAYCAHMASQRVHVTRMRYQPAGEVTVMFSDAWVSSRNLLIEAKNSQERDALRQAIGQLYDYRRFHKPVRPLLAVLLSYEPKGDRLALLQSADIEAIWPKRKGGGFLDTVNGAYV